MKKQLSESVLQDWVHDLTFQMQALLLTAMRGPDGCNKHNSAKEVVRYLRGSVLKPAGDWRGDNDNDFMWGQYKFFKGSYLPLVNDHDGYPHHFLLHLIHCAEVVGYKHPDSNIRENWLSFYLLMSAQFHMTPETEDEMDYRLNDFGCGIHNKQHEENQ